MDPDVPLPELTVPDSFRQTANKDAAAPTPPSDFWMFRSARLTELLMRARAENLDVAAAIARIAQAEAQTRVAFQPLIPTIEGQGTAQQSMSHLSGKARVSHFFQTQLAASYILDIWGRNTALWKASQASAYSASYQAAAVAIATDAMVASTYFNAIGTQKQIEIAKQNLAIAEKTLEAIRARNKAGTASGLDVAQQETLTWNVRVTIPPLERNLQQNKHALAVLVGTAPEFFAFRGENLFSVRVPKIRSGLPSDLLRRRPDIAAAEADLAAARMNVSAAQAALFPTIQLTASGGFESAALQTLFSPQSTFYNLAAGATQPLTNLYALRALEDQNKALHAELLNNYRGAIISAFRDVDDALVAYRKTAEQERLQQSAVASARKAYEIAQAQLRGGIIDITTMLQVQQTLFTAENALAVVRIARLQAAVFLYQALGGGWLRPDNALVAQVPSLVEVRAKVQ